ncbi:MAG: DUF4139 domain-containing protein, partial [Planctomycetes bacterium]|nr:DUF4139 domain-containing protein [Planctomycetota bacterium]
ITKTLRTFAIDLTNNPTLFQLLTQVRGRELIVQATHEIRGTMVGAESRPQPVPGGEPIKADYINLLTEEGLQSIAISAISRIQMADADLEQEFRAALKILASAHNTDKKTVTIKFQGEGQRPVRVGYIREAPVWKTSYRLVLDDEKDSLLQGWAIVENTGDQDWKDVELSLVSGRPISFTMDLYSPLYATRPRVEHELYASLRPQSYDQDMSSVMSELKVEAQSGSRGDGGKSLFRRFGGKEKAVNGVLAFRSGGRGGGGGALGGGYGGEGSEGNFDGDDDPFGEIGGEPSFDMSESIAAVAEAGEVGELFRYDIAMPVSIKRQRSAMLPIINQAVETSKISIYNQSVHTKHPLNGIRLKNTSDLHLMQGPITLFDGGVYAGDAKIPDLPAGSERLVSYAIDLDVEVAPKHEATAKKLVTVKMLNGLLHTTQKYTRRWSYTIKNSGDQSKTVLVEHPLHADWKLVEPEQADETTRNRHRFAVEPLPGQVAELKIVEERLMKQAVHLRQLGSHQYEFYLSADEVSEEIKAALQEIQRRRAALAALNQQHQRRQTELAVIGQEQSRIRKNMQQLPHNSELYKRYIKKFTEQEDSVERLRGEMRELKGTATEKEKELREYLEGLEVG